MVDSLSKSHRSWNMSRIKGRDTGPELIVRSVIHRLGYRFTVNGPWNKQLPGRPDIVLPRLEMIVFVHGCFWHRHGCKDTSTPKTRTEWWQNKFDANVARDKRNVRALRRDGWSVITVWECQTTHRKLPVLARRLDRILSQRDRELDSRHQ
ncbi:MAG: DNA mismatch endonuclease Vsr [Planctomycetota bacterium]